MNNLTTALRGLILALVAALALTPVLTGPAATAASSCQSSNAALAKSQRALRSAQRELAKQKKALTKAKKQHRKAKVRKLQKSVKKQTRVVNARSAQVRRDGQARDKACKSQPQPGTGPGGGTQQPDQLGSLLKMVGSIGGGTPVVIATVGQLQAVLNGFQAGLGNQFDADQLAAMLAGYQGAGSFDPAAVATLLGEDFEAADVLAVLADSPDADLVADVVVVLAELLDALAPADFHPPATVDPSVWGSLLGTVLGGLPIDLPIDLPSDLPMP